MVNWDMVSALANVVMASTAILAAWYALKQYKHSVDIQELTQMLEMYRDATKVLSESEVKPLTEEKVRSVLNLLETYERLIANGFFSDRAKEFYLEFVALSHSPTPDHAFTKFTRNAFAESSKEYRYLIKSLKAEDKFRPYFEK
ncbi:hypothetical protein A6R70_14450 [Agrobacterium rubi]|uniref:hypothetical protein n=1 Tax=Agrobacterium rubi TaxID=28099 RepID=UPI00201B54A5|nr:hypothetical protein [Agrobacterium rubi]MCL6653490.1 hypothetical protein [Agrobacterium rubi]